jgi:NADH:quinone reductase (non-electrogenic)
MRARTSMLAVGAGAALVAYTLQARRHRAMRVGLHVGLDAITGPAEVPTIAILGSGFAGVSAAQELARLLPRADDARIVLIDERGYLLFTPMLTEVVGGQIDVHDVATSVRRLSPRVAFLQARVDRVDLENKEISLVVGSDVPNLAPLRRTLRADHIVLALGSVTNFHHISGLQQQALTIKNVSEAGAMHDRALAMLERADGEPNDGTRRALLTFVVGGGGFSGVETMAALNSFVRSLAPYYPGIRDDEIRTVLVHPHERLLPELTPRLATYAQRELQARGVDVILNTKIDGAGPGYVDLEGRPRVPTHTIIWTGGVTPSPVVRDLPCRHGKHHGVATDTACRVPNYPGIWAVGDCAEIPRPGSDETYTPTAQNATREGKHVARNIVASMRGQPMTPFKYTPIGELAVVGERAGVAEVYGVHVAGLPAWLMWRAIYLAKEPNLRKRARTALDWLIDLSGPRALPEFLGRRQGATTAVSSNSAASGQASDASSSEAKPTSTGLATSPR